MVEQIILPNRPSLTDLVEEETPVLTVVPLEMMPLEKVKSMFSAFDSDTEVELLIPSSPEPIQETQPYYQSDFEQEEPGECCIVGVKCNCRECQPVMIPSAARGGQKAETMARAEPQHVRLSDKTPCQHTTYSHILTKGTMKDQQDQGKGKGKGKVVMKLKTRFIKHKIHPNSTIGPPVVLVHRQKRPQMPTCLARTQQATYVA